MTMATTCNPFLEMILNSKGFEEKENIVYMDYVSGPFVIQSVPHIPYGSEFMIDGRVQLRINELIKEAVSTNSSNKEYLISYSSKKTH